MSRTAVTIRKLIEGAVRHSGAVPARGALYTYLPSNLRHEKASTEAATMARISRAERNRVTLDAYESGVRIVGVVAAIDDWALEAPGRAPESGPGPGLGVGRYQRHRPRLPRCSPA